MNLKNKIKESFIYIIFLLVGLQNVNGQECLLDVLNNELSKTDSSELLKYFEDNTDSAYNVWKILYKADQSTDRSDITTLTELSDYIVNTKKASHVIVKEIEDAGGFAAWRKVNFGSTPDQAKKLKEDIEAFYEDYFENDLPKEVLISNVQNVVDKSFLPEIIKKEISKIDDFSSLTNVVRNGGETLFILAGSTDPLLVSYIENLIKGRRTYAIVDDKSFKAALREAEAVLKLPAVEGTEIANGSGALGRIFSGEFDGQQAIFKFDKSQEYDTTGEIERVVRDLEPYGGPRFLERVRIQDSNGVWRDAVAMEFIEGHDLLKLRGMYKRNESLPIKITSTYLDEIDKIIDRLKNEGKVLEETNLGDFILTTDPDRPIVLLDMFVKNGDIEAKGLLDASNQPIRNTIEELVNNSNSLFDVSGKFIDAILETNYVKYTTRKLKEDKIPKDRLKWKKARDYWLYDSPMARGNEFNDIGRLKYQINELNLKLNGKNVRLDSYVLPSKSDDGVGKIISRKATDLVDIQESTYRSYLTELKNKYVPGTIIRSDKYPDLDGDVIQGKQYLEIPESNKTFYDIELYKKIAKEEYNIEIIFLAE